MASELPDMIMSALRDAERVPSGLDGELLLSTLLGTAYARFAPDRGEALDGLVAQLAERATGGKDQVAALLADPGITATGGYVHGDRYGDETWHVLTFADPDHAVVLVADHTRGLVRDILVAAPAATVLDQLRTDADEMNWSTALDPASVGASVAPYLRATDLADELPDGDSLADNRWLAGRRLAGLPEPEPADETAGSGRDELLARFLESPEARLAGLTRAPDEEAEAIGYGLGLCVDFAGTRGGDPLRWSPRAVESFLLEWVHQRALLDAKDIVALPDVLAAWAAWAGRRVGLPDTAVAATLDRIDALRTEFARLGTTGERQSPAVRAAAQLVAEGVDLADPAAVEEWLGDYNARS